MMMGLARRVWSATATHCRLVNTKSRSKPERKAVASERPAWLNAMVDHSAREPEPVEDSETLRLHEDVYAAQVQYLDDLTPHNTDTTPVSGAKSQAAAQKVWKASAKKPRR